jgi:2-polyprenyl-3-methyl-5-hydroxy-6-metoxy-1,4-benzoquinol methylase
MLKFRSTQPELMDDLDASGPVINQTLRELDTINRFLGGNRLSIQGLQKIVKGHEDMEIVVADLGCGGGEMMKLMADWGKKNGYTLKFIGIDANEHIIEYAKSHCAEYPEISFMPLNIFSKEFNEIKFDIIHSSLFTHHFTDEELVELFSKFKQQARLGIIMNDLHRHWFAYFSIKLITYLFSKSKMVRNDACLSVARAFKKSELSKILNKAGLEQFSLNWKWAFRWKMVYISPAPFNL